MKIVNRVALAACVALGALTPASANHSWGSYHWARTANPFALKINEALTSNWEPYLQVAMDDWGTSSVLDFNPTTAAPSSASAKRCDPITGQILVCNASYGQRGWLGIASIWASGNHTTKGTTKLNDTYFNMAQYNTPAWRQMVTCQEIGHDFGLDHQDENFSNDNLGTCMDYTNNPTTNQHPNAHDFEQLEAIYAHVDNTNSYTSSAAATNFGIREVGRPTPQAQGDAGVGDTMADWGQAIGRDGKGRPDTFVRQLGGGRKVITHVLWALDAKGTEAN
jgi:hypothetical protein